MSRSGSALGVLLVTSSIEDLTVIDIVMDNLRLLLLVFLNVLTSILDKGSFRLVPVKASEMPSIGANKYLNISYSNNWKLNYNEQWIILQADRITGVAFYSESIPRCHLYFRTECGD